MIVFLFFCKKPICLQLFFLCSDDDVLADILFLEIGGLEFLYFYFGVVVLFRFEGFGTFGVGDAHVVEIITGFKLKHS